MSIETSEPVIDRFAGKYAFLSNFYLSPVVVSGRMYPTAEHAFQAHKSIFAEDRNRIARCPTPAEAKKMGSALPLRADWSAIRYSVMERVVMAKFSQNSDLADQLLQTGNARLVEGNTWGDTLWGVYKGRGYNWLGEILMRVRDKLRSKAKAKAKRHRPVRFSLKRRVRFSASNVFAAKTVRRSH